MEENSSRNNMINCPSGLEEVIIERNMNIIKSNSFPFRVKKEDNVHVFSLIRRNSMNNNRKPGTPAYVNIREGPATSALNSIENVKIDSEFTGKPSSVIDSPVPSNSTISSNQDTASYNCSEIVAKYITCNEKDSTKPILTVAQTPKTNIQLEEAGQWVVRVDPADELGIENEPYPVASNYHSGTLQSTSSRQIADTALPECRPQRPNRNNNSHRSTTHRSETPLTQVPTNPLSNLPLSSHVEEALGIFNQFKSYQPTVGSAVFSILMTIVFVGILWIVVYTIFGPKGHAIAGIFLSIFILGFLLNTCFIKFYFRLRLFFGIEHLREQSIMARNIAAMEQQREEELRQQRAMEPPPSYLSVIESSPPPYSIAKHMKAQPMEETSIKYQKSPNSSKKHQQADDSIAMSPLTASSSVKFPQSEESILPPLNTSRCRNCLMKGSAVPTLCSSCKASVLYDLN